MKPFFFSSYFITDPKEFGDTTQALEKNLKNSFETHTVDMICFRDKLSQNKLELAKTTLNISRKYKIKKVLINGDINLAVNLGFDGVHLTSTQFEDIPKAKQHNLFVLISCHSEDEIKKAKKLGVDGVTYSPIFYKENKGEPKGIENLKKVVQIYQDENFSIIALGGIVSKKEVDMVRSTNSRGFASIRYFISV